LGLERYPEEARAFDAMMAHFPDNRHAAVAEAYDLSAAQLVADVGGGNGAMLRHVLARAPAARGLLFDRPDVVAALGPEALLDGRIRTVGGSFLDTVPAGADHVILSRVLHDWPEEGCTRILANCRAAMAPGAVLPAEIFARLQHPYTKALFDAVPGAAWSQRVAAAAAQ
jgi:trans-aconitate methyltransferase